MILEICWLCAPRRSEIVSLEKKDLIALENFWLHIPPVKTKPRECKIPKSLYDELMSIKTNILFPQYFKKPDTLSKALEYKLKKYSLPKITFHQFRYSKVLALYQKGWNMKEIQLFIGHSKIETTNSYLFLKTEYGRIPLISLNKILK